MLLLRRLLLRLRRRLGTGHGRVYEDRRATGHRAGVALAEIGMLLLNLHLDLLLLLLLHLHLLLLMGHRGCSAQLEQLLRRQQLGGDDNLLWMLPHRLGCSNWNFAAVVLLLLLLLLQCVGDTDCCGSNCYCCCCCWLWHVGV